VRGDLHVRGAIKHDFRAGFLVVLGDLTTEAIVTTSQVVVTGALTVTDTLYGSCTNYATIVLGPARARLLVSVKEHLFSLYGARSFDTIVDIDGDTANLDDRTYARNEAPLRAGLDIYDESAVFAALAGGLLRS